MTRARARRASARGRSRSDVPPAATAGFSTGGGVLRAFGEGEPGGYQDLREPLSELIERLNERFGADLSEADRLHLEGIVADLAADPEMQQRAAATRRRTSGWSSTSGSRRRSPRACTWRRI
jgi:hypothetical protein